jgi:hypothetical protein
MRSPRVLRRADSADPHDIDDLQRAPLQTGSARPKEIQMIRFLGILVVICIVVASVGFLRGWFHAGSTNTNGQGTVTVTVDQNKLDQDKASAQQEVQNLTNK